MGEVGGRCSPTPAGDKEQEKVTRMCFCHSSTCYYHFVVTAVIAFCLMASACQIYIIKQELNDLRQEVMSLETNKMDHTSGGQSDSQLGVKTVHDSTSKALEIVNDDVRLRRSLQTSTRGDREPSRRRHRKKQRQRNKQKPVVVRDQKEPTVAVSPERLYVSDSHKRGSRSQRSGSSFIRWGRWSCPHSSKMLYSGYAAGAYPMEGFGGSSELVCLPSIPSWNDNSSTPHITKTLLTAAKFNVGVHVEVIPPAANKAIIACAVCVAKRMPAVMIPGWVNCPRSWEREYRGYLMSSPSIPNQYYFSSHYCVDHRPDYYRGYNDTGGPELTFVQAGHCYGNREPCANYEMRNRIGCALCSKAR